MPHSQTLRSMSLGIAITLFILGCSGGGDHDTSDFVTLRGQVLASYPASPVVNAACTFVSFERDFRARTVAADANGMFEIELIPDIQGLLGCYPPGLTNLTLLTFVSTDGVPAGATLPVPGIEEVSPRTTVIANIIVQTSPSDPQGRKIDLLDDLDAQEPDITVLSGAATDLFNRMRQRSISDVPFSTDSDIFGEGDGDDGASDGGGAAGEAGDGADFSPLSDVQCEFALGSIWIPGSSAISRSTG